MTKALKNLLIRVLIFGKLLEKILSTYLEFVNNTLGFFGCWNDNNGGVMK